MKKIFLISIVIIMLLNVHAQSVVTESFLTDRQVPDAAFYLPSPPDTSSVAFLCDYNCYLLGKSLRNTPRGKQADFDTYWETDSILRGFASSFGMQITKETTPVTYELMYKVCIDAEKGVSSAKKRYLRKRPYVQFNEHTGCQTQEDELRHTGSYPSGHSARGWAIALVLSELNPERQNMIMERGYQYGESRVIEGYHYQSDVEAARLSSSAVVARLHAERAFMMQIDKAKKELRKFNIP